MGKKNRLNPE